MQNMDALDIANILATELWCQQLASLEGLNSGVPTRTTATITPTQLRSFEQTYIELNGCAERPHHAGFVPPSLTHANNYGTLNHVGYSEGPTTTLHVSPGPLSSESSSSPGLPPKRRNMGGRRPTRAPQDSTPEEEERRKVRRERNKMAAARCRKRRLDHTNELEDETSQLEAKKRGLLDEIDKLKADQKHLQSVLQAHRRSCRLVPAPPSPPDVKPFNHEAYTFDEVRVKEEVLEDPVLTLGDHDIFTTPATDQRVMFSSTNLAVAGTLQTPPVNARPNRPSFLQVPPTVNPAQIHNKALGNKIAGVEITTPSNGIPFNFDSLMEGGTGLTPVHPHPHPHPCAAQQRAAPDLSLASADNTLGHL